VPFEGGLIEWCEWQATADMRVAFTRVFDCEVSTVFLGSDMAFRRLHPGQPPILFESMAFWPGDGGYEQMRCATWLEAEEQRREVARPAAVWAWVRRAWRWYWYEAGQDARAAWRELRG